MIAVKYRLTMGKYNISGADIPPLIKDTLARFVDFMVQFGDNSGKMLPQIGYHKIIYSIMLSSFNDLMISVDQEEEINRVRGLIKRESKKKVISFPQTLINNLTYPSSSAVEITKIYVRTFPHNNNVYINVIITAIKNEQEIEFPFKFCTNQFKCKIENLLFYYTLGMNSSQNWGMPKSIFNQFKNQSQSIECFASEINHTLPNYFSPMGHLDPASKGEFFSSFIDAKYQYYFITPPSVEQVITGVFQYTFAKLRQTKSPIHLLFLLPFWSDLLTPFLKELDRQKIFTEDAILKRGKYAMYNAVSNNSIKCSVDYYLLRINTGVENVPDMYTLSNLFSY